MNEKSHLEGVMEFEQVLREMEQHGARVIRTLTIYRKDVEAMNLKPYLSPLKLILKDRDAVIRRRQDVRPCIAGYDSDPRELYQVPEVREFLSRMDQQFPYWFYFVDPACGFLPILMASLCPLVNVDPSADGHIQLISLSMAGVTCFMDRHFNAMNFVFDHLDLDDPNITLINQMRAQIMKVLDPMNQNKRA